MSRIFITGSSDGLGLNAARSLMAEGHEVLLHARTKARAAGIDGAERALGVVIGDLSSAVETTTIADQVNAIGRMDAIIHNAGIYQEPDRGNTPEGHAKTLAINTLAPYMLTALIARPDRLIYLSSGMHTGGTGSLADIDWVDRRWNATQAYCESKLQAAGCSTCRSPCPSLAGRFQQLRRSGLGAHQDGRCRCLRRSGKSHLTQTWLAVSADPAAKVKGAYWHHRQQRKPAAEVVDPQFQDRSIETLARLTGIVLP